MLSDRCLSVCLIVLSVTFVYSNWGQTVGWIMMKLGMHVGLGPGQIVLDGNPAPPPEKGAESPNFRPISIVAKRVNGLRCHLVWRYLSPGDFVLDGNPAPLPSP